MTAKKTAKKTSKSVAKRIKLQTGVEETQGERTEPQIAKADAKKVETVDSKDVTNEILERLTKLEAKQIIIIDSYAFISAQITGLYGMGGLGAVFDAISEKLSGK